MPTSAFNRPKGVDKRLCRQVITGHRAPTHWTPMNPHEVECKLMEVRKYSHDYYDVESKFRRPNLNLITAYAVQNPFLMGAFMLRKEQLTLQLAKGGGKVKEKRLYYSATFSQLELIVRNNFCAVGGQIKFYESAKDANEARAKGDVMSSLNATNLRANVGSTSVPFFTSDGLSVDTVTNEDADVFIKYHVNDVYPDHVLVYRDKEGPDDSRTSRLSNIVKFCQISYRAGTRFNPDEVTFKGKKSADIVKKGKEEEEEDVVTVQPSNEDDEEDSRFSGTGAVPKRAKKKVI